MNDADTLTRLTLGPLPGLRELRARPDRVAERAQAVALRPAPVSRVQPHDAERELDASADEPRLREPIASERGELARPRMAVFTPPLRNPASAAIERASTSPLSAPPARAPGSMPIEGARSVVETVERIVEPRIVAATADVGAPGLRMAEPRETAQPVTSEQTRVLRTEPVRAGSSEASERIMMIERRRAEAPAQPSPAAERVRPERASAQPQALAPTRERAVQAEQVQPASVRRSIAVEPTPTSTTRPTTSSPTAEIVARPVAKLARVAVDTSPRATEVRPRAVATAEPRPINPRPVARGPIAAPRPKPSAPPSVRVSVGRIEIRTTPSARAPSRRAPAPARAHAITPVLPGVV